MELTTTTCSWGKVVHDFGVVGADELAIKSLACHPVYDVAIDLPVLLQHNLVSDALLRMETDGEVTT